MYAFLALTFIVSKDLLEVLDPILMIILRMGLCSIIFAIYLFFTTSINSLSLAYLRSVIILGFFNVYAANVLQIICLEYIDPINASLWYNSTPFIIALLNFLIYRTKITRIKVISLCLGWLAFVPLVLTGQHVSASYGYGAIYFLLSASAMAMSALLLEKNKSIASYPMSLTNVLSLAIGALFAWIHYSFFLHRNFVLHLSLYNYFVLTILIASTVICAGLYIYFVRKYSALLVTFAGFSLPIFSMLLELLLGKKVDISLAMVISITLITGALYLFTLKK